MLDFDDIRRAVPIALLVAHYKLDRELKRKDHRLIGKCPIHHGTNSRQFVIDLRKNVWHCFGDCQRGGGTLELVVELEKTDRRGAAQRICEIFALRDPAANVVHSKRSIPMSGKPTHKVFVVEDRDPESEDQKGFWTRVGSAWPHKDGKGFNLVIASGLSVSGRVVLREADEEDEKASDKTADAKPNQYAKASRGR